MKKRDLVLDFTSLLDVIMIILFFFIMFSHFDMKENYDTKEQKLEQEKEVYNAKEQELEQEKNKVEKRLEELKHLDETKALNQEALWDLEDGQMLEFIIESNKVDDNSLKLVLTIRKDEKELAQMEIKENMSDEIKSILDREGYDKKSYIFGTIYFNGETDGTNEAVKNVENTVKLVRAEYTNFYTKMFNISKTNIITNQKG